MSIQEHYTSHLISETKGTELLTILVLLVRNPQFAVYLLTGHRRNFLSVEGFTTWVMDFSQFLSPLFEANISFDGITLNHQATVMNFDSTHRKTINYAAPLSCKDNPRADIFLDFDKDEH